MGQQAEGDEVVAGLGDRARAERGEPAAGGGQRRLVGTRGECAGVPVLQEDRRVVDARAVEQRPGGQQDVEEAVVLEAGVGVDNMLD